MVEKRFVLERSDYDLKYEFRVADISKVKKTKEDFWNEEEEIYEYRKYIAYLWENDAFLTLEEADELLNTLHEENQALKKQNKMLRTNVGKLTDDVKYLRNLPSIHQKENEQLKQQNADWETSFDKCKHYKEAYGTEIVKIKQTIKDMIKTERTELGRSVLKQLWEAIQ